MIELFSALHSSARIRGGPGAVVLDRKQMGIEIYFNKVLAKTLGERGGHSARSNSIQNVSADGQPYAAVT